MSAGTTAPPQPGEGDLCMHNDWFESGWPHVLPSHQAMWMAMLFSTATVRQLEGDLDTIAVQVFGDDPGRTPRGLGDQGLESPVAWLDEESLEAAGSQEEAAEITEDARVHRRRCEESLRAAGFPVPATVRELAAVMERLGITHRSGGYWSMPDRFPRPEDVLPLSGEIADSLLGLRKFQAVDPVERALLDYATHTLGSPAQFSTSLQRLERATGFDADELRAALDHLVSRDGEIQLHRGQPPAVIAAKDLTVHSRFQITLDWAGIDEARSPVVHVD
ncbi:hypothetical protein A6A06_25040 [Streptomyces sp. CB02923]|uniref:DUF6042 family protein n=1 Tax=Streptomyces sp. CB02923 TaxID=1718985 RepID=UPI00093D5126|nr:DUF6042 family protein [Streptomyces sp. CB02923]OKH98886.1 hypothetical protein A6A06_25040 [Streptomyces sp. CB02923]